MSIVNDIVSGRGGRGRGRGRGCDRCNGRGKNKGGNPAYNAFIFDTFGHLKCRFNSKKYLKVVKIWLLHSVDYV
jgi:hypothetical protein